MRITICITLASLALVYQSLSTTITTATNTPTTIILQLLQIKVYPVFFITTSATVTRSSAFLLYTPRTFNRNHNNHRQNQVQTSFSFLASNQQYNHIDTTKIKLSHQQQEQYDDNTNQVDTILKTNDSLLALVLEESKQQPTKKNTTYTQNGSKGEVVGGLTGRIGSFLLKSGKGHLAPILRGVCPGYQSPKGTPIYISIPSCFMDRMIQCTHPNRKEDLVFVGNYLFDFDVRCTICIPHFSISSTGSNPIIHTSSSQMTAPPTYIYGRYASHLKEIFRSNHIPTEIISTLEEMYILSIRKLIWSSILWLVCHSTTPPLDITSAHDSLYKPTILTLIEEIIPAANVILCNYTSNTDTTIGSVAEIYKYLESYSLSLPKGVIPSIALAMEELEDRNMRFIRVRHDTDCRITQPLHESLLQRVLHKKNKLKNVSSSSAGRNLEKASLPLIYKSPHSNLAFLYQEAKHRIPTPDKQNNHTKRIIIVGGGIIGSSIAYYLSSYNHTQITVFDESPFPKESASLSSWAWINANSKKPLSYRCLNMLGVQAWKRDGVTLHLPTWCGSLVYRNRTNIEEDGSYCSIGPLTTNQLNQLQPDCNHTSLQEEQVYFYPDEGHVNPFQVIPTIQAKAQKQGNVTIHDYRVHKLLRGEDGTVIGISTNDHKCYYADVVIVAAGRGTSDASLLGKNSIPMRDSPGYLSYAHNLNASSSTTLTRIIVDQIRDIHFLYRAEEDMYVIGGAPLEFGGSSSSDTTITATAEKTNTTVSKDKQGTQMLQNAKQSSSPLTKQILQNTSYSHTTVANRPIPIDGYPAVGYVEENVYVVVTHSGITLGLLLGDLVAEEILNGVSMDVLDDYYRPGRFFN